MSATISRAMGSAQAAGAAVLIDGGAVELFQGPRADRFGGLHEAKLLVSVPIGAVAADGPRAYALQPLAGYGVGTGRADWYRIVGKTGVLIEGGVADLANGLLSVEIAVGARVTLAGYEYLIPTA